ncbi:MAG: hypothetical protein EON54_26240 [Alcaligenaceae bacterium]|nr:MAG: hypothetical protein EON54_26240 [Alcaligenaceae bacterium]
MVAVISGLNDYPVLSDDEWSKVEQEMVDEHWDSYGKSDTVDTVAKAIGAEYYGLTDAAEDIITTVVFYGLTETGVSGGYPYVEDGSSVDFNSVDVAEWIKARMGTVVTIGSYGLTLDLRPRNLINA